MLLRQTVVLTATGSGLALRGTNDYGFWFLLALARTENRCVLGSSAFCDRREIVYAAPEPVKLFGPEIFTAWALSKQLSGILFTFLPFLVCFSSFVFVSGARWVFGGLVFSDLASLSYAHNVGGRLHSVCGLGLPAVIYGSVICLFGAVLWVLTDGFLRVFLARDYGALAQSRLVMSSLIVNRVLRRLLRWRVSSLVLGGNAYLASSWLRKDVISLPAYDVLYASSFSFVALSAPLTGASSASTLLILNMSLSASRLVVLLLLLPPVSVS
ncbi:hypothetical protein DY000_02039565 [Brassica cretica]|uniref:Uncharacterized protein n=1 Tax=Brassica cretica TaxID=69181 RepID=A0ABQ7B501_BRACR|nr:hypothetical protein DY000_02039565 [Brassica cretica]